MSEPLSTDPLSRYIPPETADQAKVDQRNWFYESLSVEAKSRFLDALKEAETRGMSADAAWEEAVVAAETTYAAEPGAADVDAPGASAATMPRSYDPADKVDNL